MSSVVTWRGTSVHSYAETLGLEVIYGVKNAPSTALGKPEAEEATLNLEQGAFSDPCLNSASQDRFEFLRYLPTVKDRVFSAQSVNFRKSS